MTFGYSLLRLKLTGSNPFQLDFAFLILYAMLME